MSKSGDEALLVLERLSANKFFSASSVGNPHFTPILRNAASAPWRVALRDTDGARTSLNSCRKRKDKFGRSCFWLRFSYAEIFLLINLKGSGRASLR